MEPCFIAFEIGINEDVNIPTSINIQTIMTWNFCVSRYIFISGVSITYLLTKILQRINIIVY
jgi:hypothetical protein